ncbi:MAG: riboflavin biosynthesis protein RibF, partial [Lancefieldella parvula]
MNKVERIAQSVLFESQLPTPLELGDADFYTLHSDCFKQPCVCVLGVFDGLHEGHQGLLAIAKKDAEARKVPLVAVTFLPDPVEVLFDGSPQRLLSGKDRLRALAAWGVDGILVHHFTREFAALSGTQYV